MIRAALRSGGALLAALRAASWRCVLLCVLCAGTLALAGPARAQDVAPGGEIVLRYNNKPLTKLVEDIAKLTGERFIVDPALPGTLTILIGRPLTRGEALAVLDTALMMEGFALLRGPGGIFKVMPIKDAATGSQWSGPGELEDRDRVVTTMVKLETASAGAIAASVQPLVFRDDVVVPYEPTNSLILSGSESRLRNLIEVVQALDADQLGTLWIRTLRHRDAIDTAAMLDEALTTGATPEMRVDTLQVWADERTNSLIVFGSGDEIARAREFIDTLDQATTSEGEIQVVRVLHRPAEEISEQLTALAFGRALVNRDPNVSGADLLGKPFFAVADPATNSIVVSADTETFAAVRDLIERLDRDPPRIQVDVTAYEVSNPSRLRLGVDWFLPVLAPSEGDDTALAIGSNPSGGGLRGEIGEDITFFGRASRDPLVIPFVDDEGNPVDVVLPRETVVITAESREVKTRVLMQPSLLVVSGEEQRIFAGQNVPILIGQTGQDLSGVQTVSNVERQDVGVELRVTPFLGQQGDVRMLLNVEISRVTPSVAGDPNLVGPTIEKRQIETEIFLEDGEVAVVGMSQDATRREDESGAPFLKDIPILGHAVKSGGKDGVDTHIVFAVQARILHSYEEDLAESIRQRLALERSQARVRGLRKSPSTPYAVLVSTYGSREDAETLAASFERDGAEAQVGAWKQLGGGGTAEERFDVYLTGYPDFDAPNEAALRLRERGFSPQVVVLPGTTVRATPPALQMLGSRPGVASAEAGADTVPAAP